MKLTLGNLAHLAEIIGAVAIVISLVYVGRELNANTAAVQASSLQAVTNASSASMLAVVENEDFAMIRVQAMRDPSELSITGYGRATSGSFAGTCSATKRPAGNGRKRMPLPCRQNS